MVCGASDELKELQMRIQHAYLNKERAAQITESQYRQQIEIVTTPKTPNFSSGTRHQH
jgi:hypothetical protein